MVFIMEEEKLCKNCNKKLDDDWKYCPYCGTMVT
jgi:RNA polymerase subunit RPABC4/transcription elongation factor Spt4